VHVPVSVTFTDPAAVERAVGALIDAAVPRDLIDIVVSPTAAQHFYQGIRTAGTRQTLRYAAIFGLVQLGVSSVVSLAAISLDDFVAPGATAVVQLLGPNMATMLGAGAGAIFGYFHHRSPRRYHARAAEEPDAIVVVVRASTVGQATALGELLEGIGGQKPRLEPT
jgi:hypothetical protein